MQGRTEQEVINHDGMAEVATARQQRRVQEWEAGVRRQREEQQQAREQRVQEEHAKQQLDNAYLLFKEQQHKAVEAALHKTVTERIERAELVASFMPAFRPAAAAVNTTTTNAQEPAQPESSPFVQQWSEVESRRQVAQGVGRREAREAFHRAHQVKKDLALAQEREDRHYVQLDQNAFQAFQAELERTQQHRRLAEAQAQLELRQQMVRAWVSPCHPFLRGPCSLPH